MDSNFPAKRVVFVEHDAERAAAPLAHLGLAAGLRGGGGRVSKGSCILCMFIYHDNGNDINNNDNYNNSDDNNNINNIANRHW